MTVRKESVSNDSPEVVKELKEIMETTSDAIETGEIFAGTRAEEPIVEFLSPVMHVENPCVPPTQIMFLVHDLSWIAAQGEERKKHFDEFGMPMPDERKSVRYVNIDVLPAEVKSVVMSVLNLMNGSEFIPDLPAACERLSKRVNEINAFRKAADESEAEREKRWEELKQKFERNTK